MTSSQEQLLRQHRTGQALVTGGRGFIGGALRRHLRELGINVTTLDSTAAGNDAESHRQGSILDKDSVLAAVEGMDLVFHLAGLVGTTELLSSNAESIAVNIVGTVNVLEGCRVACVRTILVPTKPNDWLNTYSITKKAAEDFSRMYAQLYGMDVRLLRWLNVYGPGQKIQPVRKAVPTMILQALHGVDIEVFGDGEQPVYLTYVDDLARTTALYASAVEPSNDLRDTGNSIRLTVNDMATLILRLTGSRARIRHLPMRPGEDPRCNVTLLDGVTAADIVGTADTTTPLEDGMMRTIEYYSAVSSDIREQVLSSFARDPAYMRQAATTLAEGNGL